MGNSTGWNPTRWDSTGWVGLVLAALLAGTPGCSRGEREVIVTRDEVGSSWPLAVNSATVVCGSAERGIWLKLGPERYALDEAARARGLPDAKQLAVEIPVDPSRPEIGTWPGDVSALGEVCEDVAASE